MSRQLAEEGRILHIDQRHIDPIGMPIYSKHTQLTVDAGYNEQNAFQCLD